MLECFTCFNAACFVRAHKRNFQLEENLQQHCWKIFATWCIFRKYCKKSLVASFFCNHPLKHYVYCAIYIKKYIYISVLLQDKKPANITIWEWNWYAFQFLCFHAFIKIKFFLLLVYIFISNIHISNKYIHIYST